MWHELYTLVNERLKQMDFCIWYWQYHRCDVDAIARYTTGIFGQTNLVYVASGWPVTLYRSELWVYAYVWQLYWPIAERNRMNEIQLITESDSQIF